MNPADAIDDLARLEELLRTQLASLGQGDVEAVSRLEEQANEQLALCTRQRWPADRIKIVLDLRQRLMLALADKKNQTQQQLAGMGNKRKLLRAYRFA